MELAISKKDKIDGVGDVADILTWGILVRAC